MGCGGSKTQGKVAPTKAAEVGVDMSIRKSRKPLTDQQLEAYLEENTWVHDGVPMDIRIACENLAKKDVFSESDPVCILYEKNFLTGRWVYRGRSELLVDAPNPEWKTTFTLGYDSEADPPQRLRFEVWDVDDPVEELGGELMTDDKKHVLGKHLKLKPGNFLGQVEVSVADLRPASTGIVERILVNHHNSQMIRHSHKQNFVSVLLIDCRVPAHFRECTPEDGKPENVSARRLRADLIEAYRNICAYTGNPREREKLLIRKKDILVHEKLNHLQLMYQQERTRLVEKHQARRDAIQAKSEEIYETHKREMYEVFSIHERNTQMASASADHTMGALHARKIIAIQKHADDVNRVMEATRNVVAQANKDSAETRRLTMVDPNLAKTRHRPSMSMSMSRSLGRQLVRDLEADPDSDNEGKDQSKDKRKPKIIKEGVERSDESEEKSQSDTAKKEGQKQEKKEKEEAEAKTAEAKVAEKASEGEQQEENQKPIAFNFDSVLPEAPAPPRRQSVIAKAQADLRRPTKGLGVGRRSFLQK